MSKTFSEKIKEATPVMPVFDDMDRQTIIDLYQVQFDEFEVMRWRYINLQENAEHWEEKQNEMRTRLADAQEKADHMDILTQAVGENPMVKDAWDKFMLMLRMNGYG